MIPLFTKIGTITLTVRDQQEALDWYTEKLGFTTFMDDAFTGQDGKEHRWLTIGLPGQPDLMVALAPVAWGPGTDAEKEAAIGQQGWVLHTDDCRKTVEELRSRGVTVVDEPMEMPWGTSALITDLYGNTHNVLEYRAMRE